MGGNLLAAGLVDELNLLIAPAVVGGGRALFSGAPKRIDLGPVELTRCDSGAFVARYDIKHG